jgi:hypothetical protein
MEGVSSRHARAVKPNAMSPLLTISLAIAISLWAIPLTWALLAGVRALSRSIRSVTDFRDTLVFNSAGEEDRRLLYAQLLLEDEYQILKDDVIRKRALIARTIDLKPELDEKIRLLTQVLQELEATNGEHAAGGLTVAQRLKEHGMRAQLARFQGELQEFDSKLASLRVELEEKEQELKKAAPSKQVLIFKPKPDAANTRIANVDAETAVEKRIRRIDLALKKREVRVSEKPVYYQALVEYQELFDFLDGALICTSDVGDLRQLVQSTRETLHGLDVTVQYRNTDKEFLIAQLDASETELESRKYRSLLEEFENQTLELRGFEKKFSQLKEEFLMKVAELESEPIDFDPKE